MDKIGILINLITFVFSVGIIYGSFNTRIKAIEKQIDNQKETGERLARIEEQIKQLILRK
jgi:hypothetical protein